MPIYEVITPLRNGGPDPVQPGEVVELSDKEGEQLIAVGAVKPASEPEPELESAPADLAPADPAPAPATRRASRKKTS